METTDIVHNREIKIWHSFFNRSSRELSNEQRNLKKKNPEKSGKIRNPGRNRTILCHYIGLVLRAGHSQPMIALCTVQCVHDPFCGLKLHYLENGFVPYDQGQRPITTIAIRE